MNSDLFQLALSYHQSELLDQAEEIYKQLLEANPNDPNVLHLYGILSAQKGHYEQSLDLITRALEIEPNSSTFHNSMGNVLWYLEKVDDAIDHYEKSIQLQPNSPAAHNNLGNLYAKKENYEAAIKHYQNAINLKNDYPDAYYNLAIVLVKLSRNEEAINNLQKAVSLQPNFAAAQKQLAQLLQQGNQLEKALHHYQEQLQTTPDDVETFVNIGAILIKQGEFQKAIEYFHKAIDIDPNHAEAHYNLGSTYLSLQNIDEALQHYLRCLNQKPDADSYFNIGVIYMYKDRYLDAIDYFNSALEINPNFFEAQVNLAATYLKIENYDKALIHYQKALEINPNNDEVKYIISAITEKNSPLKAPTDFVQHLFDQYAPYFETHLTKCLNYQAHKLIFEKVSSLLKNQQDLIIVDLGCGTGLCGELFKPYAKKLIGVDISPKMIELAQEKNVYDELLVDDLLHALSTMKLEIDLILAADVFGYMGDLVEVFRATYNALKQEGYFAFTVEKSKDKDYSLQKTTRFTHSKKYIHSLSEKNSFKIMLENEVQLRVQRQTPVYGYLFILQKNSV